MDLADVRRVQGCGVDHEIRLSHRGTAHVRVSQISEEAGLPARCPIDSSNHPTIRPECFRDRRANEAGSPGDRSDTDRFPLVSSFVHRTL